MENITVFIISFFLLVVVCSSSAFVIHHQNETQLSLKHRPPFTENLNIRRTKTKQTDTILTWRYEHNIDGKNARRGLTEDKVRHVMKQAMHLWEEKTNIKFVEDRDATDPNINMTFVSREHGDGSPFDGVYGVIAHAWPYVRGIYPGIIHFDDDEHFAIGRKARHDEISLMWFAVHELGHVLGLNDSLNKDDIMVYKMNNQGQKVELSSNDVFNIQKIYGVKNKSRVVIPEHKRCPRAGGAALGDFRMNNETHYLAVSEDDNLYMISKSAGIVFSPLSSKDYFTVPNKITAIFSMQIQPRPEIEAGEYNLVFTHNGNFYICNGSQIYSGPHSFHDRDSPSKVAFPYEVKRIDAAMKWWVNGKIYFFAGTQYWRYDESRKTFDHGYPLLIEEEWSGVPSNLNAAYSSTEQQETMLLKGDQMYKLQEEQPLRIIVADGYPKSVKNELLRCTKEES